jgi:hypothetical protein
VLGWRDKECMQNFDGERPRRTWDYNMKTYLRETSCEDEGWMEVQDRV